MVVTRTIPISFVALASHVQAAVASVVASGQLAQGPEVATFEERFAAFCQAEHAVAVNNGTTALVAALIALGVGPGDEVITSPFTFIATVNAIIATGATVCFADVRDSDFCLDPASVDAAVTTRTAALVVPHLFGQCADMGEFVELTERHGLALVEDAAQAHGAEWHGRRAGSFGTGCFSFYATKNITTGEGGMVTTGDPELATRIQLQRNHGMVDRYVYAAPGHNWRMTDVQAAMGCAQLPDYDGVVAARQRNAAGLSEGLCGTVGLTTPVELPGRRHVWHQYTLLVTPAAAVDRDVLLVRLAARGVGSAIHYPIALTDVPIFRDHPLVVVTADVPVARRCARQVLSIPVHQHLAPGDVAHIVASVRYALGS